MVQVNLLPDIVLNRRREAQLRRIAASVFVIWVALVILVTLGSLAANAFRSGQLKKATDTYNTKYQQVNSPDNVAFRQEALEVQTSLKNLNQLFGQQATVSDLMIRLTQLTPAGVTIKSLQYSNGGNLSMQASATSYAEAAEFVSALKATKAPDKTYPALKTSSGGYFDNVEIDGASQSQNTVDISLSSQYHPVAASSNGGTSQ